MENNGTIVEEKKSEIQDDLQRRLKNIVNNRPIVEANNSGPAAQNQNSFWTDTSNDFKEIPKSNPENKQQKKGDEKPKADAKPSDDEEPVRELTHEEKQNSAETNVGMTQLIIEIIAAPIINYQFKNAFKPEEMDLIREKNLIYRKPEELTEDSEILAKRKFDALIHKRDEKLGKINFAENKKKSLEKAWYMYAQTTGKVASPLMYLIFASVDAIGSTVMDITQAE